MAWTITFKNRKNETCVVSIDGGSGALTPAKEPFRVQMDDDDDIFKPVRTSSGNIKIVGADLSTIKSIMCSTPLERSVTLTVNGATAWMGFVKCEAFEQALFGYNEEFSIPIMDRISALEGVYVDDTNWSSNLKSISDVFSYMWDAIYINDNAVEYPDSSYLSAEINKLNYVEFRDAEDCTIYACYDGKSYMNVLEDVCKLFGWTAMQANDSLYFLKMDKEMSQTPADTFDSSAYITTDHTMGIVKGKRSVKVTGSVNANTSSIFSFDDALSYKNLNGEKAIKITNSVFISSHQGKICFEYPMTKLTGRPIATYNDIQTAGEAMEHYVWGGNTAYGCSLEQEGWAENGYSSDDRIVEPCVIMRKCDDRYQDGRATFYLPFKSSEMDGSRLKVTFDVKTKTDPKLEWQSNPCRILYQNIYSNRTSEWIPIYCNGKCEVHPPVGIVAFSIKAEAEKSSPVYVRISNLQVKYYDDTALNTYGAKLYESKSEYSKEIKIGGGFTDDYSIDCNLVGGRKLDSAVPVVGGGSKSKMLYGYGVVKNCPISKPEETLCHRAYNYYCQSRSRACIILESSKMLDPDTVRLQGTTYNIVAQDLNARDCELKLTLQECIDYNESTGSGGSSYGGDYPDDDRASGSEDNYGDDSDYGDFEGVDYPDYDYE